jgi:hypothetical protein
MRAGTMVPDGNAGPCYRVHNFTDHLPGSVFEGGLELENW